jgi:hypothetical protein
VGLYVAVILLATLLALVLRLVGAEVTSPTTPVDLMSGIAWLGAVVLATMVIISLGLALTVLLRSGALPLLIVIIGALTELFVAALPAFAPNEFLSGVPQVFLLRNIRTLTGSLGMDTHAVALSDTGEMPYQAFVVPMVGIAAIVAAWGILFLVIADRRLRTMDVVE